jgi:multiple sugar transport system ATP-binding protein
VLRDGRLQQLGTPREVYEQPANLFVAQFLASPPLNLLPARLDSEHQLRLPLQGVESISWAVARERLPPLERLIGRKLLLGWRADALRLQDGDSDPRTLRLVAPLRLVEPQGEHSLLQFQLGEHRLQLRLPGWPALDAGKPLSLALPAEGMLVFDAESGERLNTA